MHEARLLLFLHRYDRVRAILLKRAATGAWVDVGSFHARISGAHAASPLDCSLKVMLEKCVLLTS